MKKYFLTIICLSLLSLTMNGEIVLSENFDKFTDGTEDQPAATAISDFDAMTQTAGWTGSDIRSAGGCIYMPVNALLTTPAFDLGKHNGNYSLSFKAKSATPNAFFFIIDSNGGYQSGDISAEWKQYTVTLSTGSGPSNGGLPTTLSFYGYTDMLIDDIVMDDSGVGIPVAFKSSDFTRESFTANWSEAMNAESYLLNVFTLDYDVETTIFNRKYLLKGKEVKGCSYVVDEGEFDVPYYYTVAAKAGNAVSGESNIITVSPDKIDPCEALAATDVDNNSFTANWTESSIASQYYIHVLKRHTAESAEQYVIIDTDYSDIDTEGTVEKPQKELEMLFDGDWFANMPVIAKGMIGINNQDIDFFGQAYLQSPIIDLKTCNGTVKVAFTAFARKGMKNAMIKLCDHTGKVTFVDTKKFAVSEDAADYEFTLSGGTGLSSVLITSEENGGMMFIDRLKVTVDLPAQASMILPVRTTVAKESPATVSLKGTATSDQAAYYIQASWAVKHKDGEVRQIPEVISDPSNYVWIDRNAGIDDITATATQIHTTPDGIAIYNPAPVRVTVYDMSSRCIYVSGTPVQNANVRLDAGLYIVTAGEETFKTSVGR